MKLFVVYGKEISNDHILIFWQLCPYNLSIVNDWLIILFYFTKVLL